MIGDNKKTATATIGAFLEAKKSSIHNSCNILRDGLKRTEIPGKVYLWNMFLNFIQTLGMIFTACTIIGIPVAYKWASENRRYHNSIFKFNPTNTKDELRGQVASIEDVLTSTTRFQAS